MSARGKYPHRPVVYGPTPGPWSAGLTKTKIVVSDSRGGRLATLAIVTQSIHVAEGVATSVLMAAAPDLYAALDALVEHTDAMEAQNSDYYDMGEQGLPCRSAPLNEAIAALSRARGGS